VITANKSESSSQIEWFHGQQSFRAFRVQTEEMFDHTLITPLASLQVFMATRPTCIHAGSASYD
jgi:hypothetical protein